MPLLNSCTDSKMDDRSTFFEAQLQPSPIPLLAVVVFVEVVVVVTPSAVVMVVVVMVVFGVRPADNMREDLVWSPTSLQIIILAMAGGLDLDLDVYCSMASANQRLSFDLAGA